MNDPTAAITPAQQYGIFTAIIIAGPAITLLAGPRANRWIDQGLMVLSILGALAIVITLPATSSEYATAVSLSYIRADESHLYLPISKT